MHTGPEDAADTSLSAQERVERARDRFVWWCNGLLLLFVVIALLANSLDTSLVVGQFEHP
jgi:hypothetical protein